MDEFEKLVNEIMAEYAKDGEPITREEAEQVAQMELGARQIKNYTQATNEKKKTTRERKVNEKKKGLLEILKSALAQNGINADTENEVKLHFTFDKKKYTVTLTEHRK